MAAKTKLWVTYAWADNVDGDVDFILKELEKSGELDVHFDRRRLPAGQRLWDNIEQEITDPLRCDAYCVVVTPDSLKSAACQEELAYALDRALNARGSSFPLIPLIYKVEPREMIPRLKIRLGVLLRDPNWVAQVVAAAQGRPAGVDFRDFGPWKLRAHPAPPGETGFVFALEIQPRLETIPSWRIFISQSEKDRLKGFSARPVGSPFGGSALFNTIEGDVDSTVGPLHMVGADNTLDHAHSLYLYLAALPSRLWISRDGRSLAEIDLSPIRPRVP